MVLRDGTPAEIDRILQHTHALWSDGLDLDDYRDFVHTLMASEWAREGAYRFLVMADAPDGDVAGGLKLYRFKARLDDDLVPVGGIGAVFTLPDRRGQGVAAAMIGEAHRIMSDRGDTLSLLFSEIGAAYYSRLGYRELDPHAAIIGVPEEGPPPPHGLKRMHRDDLDDVIRIRGTEDAAASFALVRDRPYWKYLLARSNYPTLHLGRDRWESRLVTAGRQGYLWSQFGRAHLGPAAKILELGEEHPGSSLRALLDDFFQECRRRGITEAETFLPPSLAGRDPRLGGPAVRHLTPPPVIPMWLPLNAEVAGDLARHAGSAVFHRGDVF